MHRLAHRRPLAGGLLALCLLGACSSSSSDTATSADATAAPSDTSANTTATPASEAPTSAAPAPDTAPSEGAEASGDFCSDLKAYQLESQERTAPVVLGQADEGEYIAWVTDTIETLQGEGPGEATDFLELQKTVIPKVLEAARNNGEGMSDILTDPAYQAAYGSFSEWVMANCSQDVVDILLQGTGGA